MTDDELDAELHALIAFPLVLYYRLVGTEPIPEPDFLAWARTDAVANHEIAWTCVTPEVVVSTVFLGIDCNWTGHGPPLLFETMVFGGLLDGYQARYATYHAAEQGHEALVEFVRSVVISGVSR